MKLRKRANAASGSSRYAPWPDCAKVASCMCPAGSAAAMSSESCRGARRRRQKCRASTPRAESGRCGHDGDSHREKPVEHRATRGPWLVSTVAVARHPIQPQNLAPRQDCSAYLPRI